MTFLAIDSPRGFANENDILRFASKAERAAFIADRQNAHNCTAVEAKRVLRREDSATETQHNALYDIRDGEYNRVYNDALLGNL